MKVLTDIKSLKQKIKEHGVQGKTIGFIPSMGALHAGHLSLIQRAKKENDIVIVSVFVNPKQFTNPDDFARYPQTIDRDINLIKDDADILFTSNAEEMYPPGFDSTVHIGQLADTGEGAFRPGHFDGMATVVLKLFNIIEPQRAYFGKKDYQQYLIVRRMVRDLNLPIEVVGCETVREESGLAMSSRNARLSPEQCEKAHVISQALLLGKKMIEGGEKNVRKVLAKTEKMLESETTWKTEYIEIRLIADFSEVQSIDSDVVILIAGYMGEVRLIDNIEVNSS